MMSNRDELFQIIFILSKMNRNISAYDYYYLFKGKLDSRICTKWLRSPQFQQDYPIINSQFY